MVTDAGVSPGADAVTVIFPREAPALIIAQQRP
jgi:hypothetical protein